MFQKHKRDMQTSEISRWTYKGPQSILVSYCYLSARDFPSVFAALLDSIIICVLLVVLQAEDFAYCSLLPCPTPAQHHQPQLCSTRERKKRFHDTLHLFHTLKCAHFKGTEFLNSLIAQNNCHVYAVCSLSCELFTEIRPTLFAGCACRKLVCYIELWSVSPQLAAPFAAAASRKPTVEEPRP